MESIVYNEEKINTLIYYYDYIGNFYTSRKAFYRYYQVGNFLLYENKKYIVKEVIFDESEQVKIIRASCLEPKRSF